MNYVDIISLAISIGLGLLSIGLAAFAIWLSLRFNDRSTDALASVKELSNDIRAMMEVSLTHQKDFSSKMLDSILEQSKYGQLKPAPGESPHVLEMVIHERLEQAEASIKGTVEDSIRRLVQEQAVDPQQTQEAIDAIKQDISRLSATAREASTEAVLPIAIRDRLERFKDYPAHYVVIAAILQTGATSLADLEAVRDKFHLPESLDEGVEHLINDHILEGELEGFSIAEDNKGALKSWLDLNSRHIARLIDHYSARSEDIGVGEPERMIARELTF